MQFTKIRFDGEKVELTWIESSDDGSRTTKLTSSDPPKKQFGEALQSFVPEVLQVLELPQEYSVGIMVRGVSIRHTDGLRGLVVMCARTIEACNSPFLINTPFLKEAADLDSESPALSSSMLQRLEDLEAEARRYLEGDRAQGSLFEDSEAA